MNSWSGLQKLSDFEVTIQHNSVNFPVTATVPALFTLPWLNLVCAITSLAPIPRAPTAKPNASWPNHPLRRTDERPIRHTGKS